MYIVYIVEPENLGGGGASAPKAPPLVSIVGTSWFHILLDYCMHVCTSHTQNIVFG